MNITQNYLIKGNFIMNRVPHMIAGGVSAGITYPIIKKALGEDPQLGEILFFTAIGTIVGALPDILEPATSPRHRGFFHSVALFSSLMYLGYRYFIKENITGGDASAAMSALLAAYGSHLALDSCTPMGLPLLTKNL
jgi:membrane-bound metal-dependent hydrolase YbcI (DUF457 family)